MSAAVRIRPSPSRIHCTTAPPMNTLPSSAYSVRPPICHATVVTSCCRDARRRRADVLQQEAAGAVGVLRHARRAAHLAEERRLLVAGDAGDRHAARCRAMSTPRRRPRSTIAPRQQARRDAEQPQQLVVPLQRVDVEQHRARRVADVGDVARVRRSASRPATCRRCRTPACPLRRAPARPARGRESSGSCSPRNRRR